MGRKYGVVSYDFSFCKSTDCSWYWRKDRFGKILSSLVLSRWFWIFHSILLNTRIIQVPIFGSGKPLNGVIISPSQTGASSISEFDPDALRQTTIWDTVATKVNNIVCPTALTTDSADRVGWESSKRFITSDKGTVRSRETLDLYQAEISAAYFALEAGIDVTGRPPWTKRSYKKKRPET